MKPYAEGDQVRLKINGRSVRGKRYRVERINMTAGTVDVRGPEGLRTVLSTSVVFDAEARRGQVITTSAPPPADRKAGKR